LIDLLRELPLHETPLEHWIRAGELRLRCGERGLSVSTPDAHVSQCALDRDAVLLTRDKIFEQIARHTRLRLAV
jgi:predicted nucleic acid-binding protein